MEATPITQAQLAARCLNLGAKTSADEVLEGVDLGGRTAIVTGANTGIGFETARALAAAGARVVMACRNAQTAEAAAQRIHARHAKAEVAVASLDLASFASVRAFAAGFGEPEIDILVANAGVLNATYKQSDGGVEHTVGVCHVGHHLLVRELLPKLLAAKAGRVVVVSSDAHYRAESLDEGAFPQRAGSYSQTQAYAQAKLCNVLFANELHRRHTEQGLSACSLHPGNLVTTEIGRDSALTRFAMKLVSPFTKTPAQGAATSIVCAVHPDPGAVGGKYFSHCQPKGMSKLAQDADAAARLWEQTERWIDAA